MLGLCSICQAPVEENKMYCHNCQAELDLAYRALELERQIEADACYERWMNGDNLDVDTPTQHSAETEPIRQPRHKHTRGIRARNGNGQ